MFRKNDPKVINSWAFYDWANSVYNLVITSTIFPIYFEKQAVHYTRETAEGTVNLVRCFGREFVNTELYSYVFSLSFLLVVAMVPLLSGIADYKGNKKSFMKFFCYLGAAACISLYFFDKDHLELSLLSPFLASIGFWGSLVFYNAYLPEIATPDMHDKVSAKGFSLGYIGSVILLVAILASNMIYDVPFKIGFLLVGVWWAGFAQITYARLPKNTFGNHKEKSDSKLIYRGFQELKKVWFELQEIPRLKKFLAAYFTYNTGLQTVMLLAVLFASTEIDWPLDEHGEKQSSGLIISIILIQLIAVLGATIMSRLSKRIGNIPVLRLGVSIWILICVIAYFIHTPAEFYVLAAMVGFVMGGVQSMSRSTYAKMLPETKDHASYFSFFDVLEKMGLVVGPFLFGWLNGLTGGMRTSVLMIMVFFIIGLLLLFTLNRRQPDAQMVFGPNDPVVS